VQRRRLIAAVVRVIQADRALGSTASNRIFVCGRCWRSRRITVSMPSTVSGADQCGRPMSLAPISTTAALGEIPDASP